ncbi:GNAT family N-acetyltransferase [Caenimonas sp. DR4.4]|uniref:GNAT family N-acetyltransferase n=1 Tax=Caenimonas aquaedulcis TaxID=2793270 RepID=A0A931H538_9BURK|nr:GNAT family N-acetyltransferase [Caenimonas aquaedulcis]
MVALVQVLDNIFWNALTGPQAKFASGAGGARRFARGFSPIVGFRDAQQPDFDALAPYCEPGEHFYCADWTGPPPAGWTVEAEATMYQMVWDAPVPDAVHDPRIERLQPGHAPLAAELAALTQPGPFGPRTPELGEYFGVFEDGRLIAMCGERVQAAGVREVSGVCTHPQAQGRGLARLLVNHVVRRQMARGEQSFLHVMRSNNGAHGLYARMGFRIHRECPVRVVAPSSSMG